ncbi:MAG: alpha/beta fold hydrolase [Hyphomicrobiaceae bacterium]
MIDPTIERFLPGLEVDSHKASTGVAYLSHGEGEPLVLFHGGSGSWTHWVRNIEPLGRSFRVTALDAPGFGASDAVDADIENDAYLELIFRAVDEATRGAKRVHVAGFSFGGSLASATAVHLGPRAASIFLTGAAGFGPSTGRSLGLVSTRRQREELGRTPTDAELHALYRNNLGRLMIWDQAKVDDKAVDMQAENVARTRFNSRRFSWSGMTPVWLSQTDCPLYVMYGEHDAAAYPSIQGRLDQCREARPDGQQHIVPECGHWVMYERPDVQNATMLAFHGAV